MKTPNHNGWHKLHWLLQYIIATRNEKLILSANDLYVIKWYMDAVFTVHPNLKIHSCGSMTYRTVIIVTVSRGGGLNNLSGKESELVGADDMSNMILWNKLLMEAQGYDIMKNIIYQDNRIPKQESPQETVKLLLEQNVVTGTAVRNVSEK